MRKLSAILLFFSFLAVIFAEEAWEGNAAVVTSGSVVEKGLFALSNSFPRYSKIEVENIETGKSVTVTVIGRIEGVSNVFILLSREAGDKIGINGSAIAPVKVKISNEPGVVSGGLPDDLPYNPDPDINPAAGVPMEEEGLVEAVKATAKEKEGKKPSEKEAEEKRPVAKEVTSEKVEEKKKEVKKEVHPGKKAEKKVIEKPKLSREELVLKALEERKPQKKLFHPPARSGNVIIVEKPGKPKGEIPQLKIEQLPETGRGEKAVPSEEYIARPEKREAGEEAPFTLPNLESPELEESRGKISEGKMPGKVLQPEVKPEPSEETSEKGISTPSLEKSVPGKTRVTVKLEATTPKPPPPSGTEEPSPPKAKAKKEQKEKKPVTEERVREEKTAPPELKSVPLKKGAYYLQLAAYYSEALANKLAGDLSKSYPVTVLSTRKNERMIYRVLVGPLGSDESGALLYWFRSKGYRDSFLRKTD